MSPVAKRLGLYFATLSDGFFTAGLVVEFVRDLLKHRRGKVVVVWDGGGNHKGPLIRALLGRNKRLTLKRLPAYAPDLNPVEAVWSRLKYDRLANFVPGGLDDLDDEVIDRLLDLDGDLGLLRILCEWSDLPFLQQPTGHPCLPLVSRRPPRSHSRADSHRRGGELPISRYLPLLLIVPLASFR